MTDYGNNINYVFRFIQHSWDAMRVTSVCSLLISGVKHKVAARCCSLHYNYKVNCTYAVDHSSLPESKPMLAVYFCFGAAGYNRSADQKISALLGDKAAKGCDVISCKNGEWFGLGTADIAFYKDFNSKECSAAEFLKLISNKFNILNDYGSGVFNFYKFIFIAGPEDPRVCYADAYRDIDGLYAAMSRMNLIHSTIDYAKGPEFFNCVLYTFAGQYQSNYRIKALGALDAKDAKLGLVKPVVVDDKLLGNKRKADSPVSHYATRAADKAAKK